MKKIICTVLAVVIVLALGVAAFADNVKTPGGSGTAQATLSTTPAAFSVTVPSTFPVTVAADGSVTCATNLLIFNNSNGMIKVTGVQVTPKNSWELVAYDTDYSKIGTNAKKFGFNIFGKNVPTSGTADVSAVSSMNGSSTLSVPYSATVATQSTKIEDLDVADIVFTVAWDTVSA